MTQRKLQTLVLNGMLGALLGYSAGCATHHKDEASFWNCSHCEHNWLGPSLNGAPPSHDDNGYASQHYTDIGNDLKLGTGVGQDVSPELRSAMLNQYEGNRAAFWESYGESARAARTARY